MYVNFITEKYINPSHESLMGFSHYVFSFWPVWRIQRIIMVDHILHCMQLGIIIIFSVHKVPYCGEPYINTIIWQSTCFCHASVCYPVINYLLLSSSKKIMARLHKFVERYNLVSNTEPETAAPTTAPSQSTIFQATLTSGQTSRPQSPTSSNVHKYNEAYYSHLALDIFIVIILCACGTPIIVSWQCAILFNVLSYNLNFVQSVT